MSFLQSRRLLAILGIALGAISIGYAVLSQKTDEERIAEVLEELCDAVKLRSDETNVVIRKARLDDAFEDLFIDQVFISIPELSTVPRGRSELVLLATRVASYYSTLDLDFSGVSIAVDEDLAKVETTATVRAESGSRGTRSDQRLVEIELIETDGDWKISALKVLGRPDE